ncbi:MAG: LysR family transcriptional regulator [Actinomyces sp.]|nr:MAG: LysR family transcriptional regulator [Actinomyces sp.]
MDLRQLNALVAVADHRTFSAAARALHTVQSNVSTHVSRLERELGCLLVDRSRGELTAEGHIVVDRARRIQAELRAIEDDLAAARSEVRGEVRAGVIGTTARWLVPALFDELSRRHPAIRLVVVEATTTSLVPQLVGDRLDLAVVNLPLDDPDLDDELLFEEDRIVIVPLSHPLAAFDEIDLARLADHPLLLPPPGTAFRDEIEADARRLRVTLVPQAEVDGLRLLTSLAFQGFGAALVPSSAAPAWLQGDWKRVRVTGMSRRQVGLAHSRRRAPSASARAVAETIRHVVAVSGPQQADIHPAVAAL